jgi:hypothetical protein
MMNLVDCQQCSLDGASARRKADNFKVQNKNRKTQEASMTRVGLNPTIPVFGRVKTFRAADRAATEINNNNKKKKKKKKKNPVDLIRE